MADGGKVQFENSKNSDDIRESDINSEKANFERDQEEEAYEFEDNEEYTFMARKPKDGTISENLLEFYYSYGYNCRKYFNLCVIDMDTIAFTAGNLIQFFNIKEHKIWFKRASMGAGIGHISVHIQKNYVFEHIAVGANGIHPLIGIYNWPSMKIITALRGGTTKRYFHLAYSPDGLLLASQGGEPDYYISIWNWMESKIMLQCKSYVQDVYNITFSKYIPGQLTSSGVGHIKFWKMSKTFTGLKLKGETGKFGNTEISDIIAIHPMPDETIISGCEWGNILLWDETLIKLEACRKGKETAHMGCITQFEYINGELISVGSDGWIRFWFYETIDHANLPDKEQFLEIQPIYEFQIMNGDTNAMLMSIQKQEPDKIEKTWWYAQDGNGGIWLLDLCTSGKEQLQKKVFICHAGPISDMDTADWGPFIATLDKSGYLHVYNYIQKYVNVVHKFGDAGSQVIWLPCQIEETGSTLICAFESGIIRMVIIPLPKEHAEHNVLRHDAKLIQILKPHSMPVTAMCLNTSCSLLVTGSNDCTIFAFNIHSTKTYPTIIPIGYVKVPSSVTCFAWNPVEEATLLVGCLMGDCVEVKLPTYPQSYTTTSYELHKCNPMSFKFASVKSSIERDAIKMKYEKEREKRLDEKRKEMAVLMAENPHIIIDEETFLMDLDEEEIVLPEIYIPEVPNKILVAQYGINGTIWLFVAGFDAGYVYEYPRPLSGKLKHNKPLQSRIIENAKDIEIHNFLFHESKKYLFLGTQHGEIYVAKIKERDPLDFSDCWILPAHEYYNGCMSKILFSYDKEMLLTCGYDGNMFSFKISNSIPHEKYLLPKAKQTLSTSESVEDIEDLDYPSLEEVITQEQQNRIISIAEERKKQMLEILRNLSEEYVKITGRNNQLLQAQQITQFELDPRITDDLEQQLRAHTTLTQEKLKFQVEKGKLKLQKFMNHFVTPITCLPFAVYGILKDYRAVHSLREIKLDTDNILKHIEIMKRYEKEQKTGRVIQEHVEEGRHDFEESEVQNLEGLLAEDFSDLSSGLGLQISQLLLKYKEKKAKLIQQQNEWRKLHERKPNLVKNRMEDEAFLEKAKHTIGEYNLKMNADFTSTTRKETAATKYKQLLDCRSKLHCLRENFNEKLKMIAVEKQRIQKEVIKFTGILTRIHIQIPLKSVKRLPQPPQLHPDVEFPEHNLKLEKYISMSEKMEQVKRQRQSLVIDQSVDHSDIEYEVLYCDDKTSFREESLYILVSSSKLKVDDDFSAQADLIRNLNMSDSIQTTWEREMKRCRIWRKMHEQDSVLEYIDKRYKQLENQLDELEKCRIDIVYQSTYMNLNLLTLYEEFIILRDCEKKEYALEEKVSQKSNERSSLMTKMQTTSSNIAMREEQIRKLQVKIKDIATDFMKATTDNKFQDFLQKIFKKKYTAIKKQNGSLDSESSETSSEETDGTVDSETEYIPFDENICPQGCDKELYEKAFCMREKRYEYEFQVKEEQREIELLQKELDADAKHLKIIAGTLKTNQEKLQTFMLEKQRKLNDISVTVLLKLHQLQNVLDYGYTSEIQNCIIFNKRELSNLYTRIGELQQETYSLEEKRKKNEIHLKRIKLDLKYMESQNKKLKDDIKEKMIQKFGRKVSLINFYETILQRLIYDTKTDVRKIMKGFANDIKNVKRDCNDGLIILESLVRNNTTKLSLLTVLEKEKFKLKKILEQSLISEESMLQIEHEHKTDIAALENILHNQMKQKYILQQDIKNLKTGVKELSSL